MNFLYTMLITLAPLGAYIYWKHRSEEPTAYDPKTYKPREPYKPATAKELLAMHMKRHSVRDHRPQNYLEPKE
jgi:hypothetical protein